MNLVVLKAPVLKISVLMSEFFLPMSFLTKTFLLKVNARMLGRPGFLVMAARIFARGSFGQINIAAEL